MCVHICLHNYKVAILLSYVSIVDNKPELKCKVWIQDQILNEHKSRHPNSPLYIQQGGKLCNVTMHIHQGGKLCNVTMHIHQGGKLCDVTMYIHQGGKLLRTV